ncbi:AAA family ATPase [Bacillus cereus group sp. Bce002]|uniref:AAA family ATPase n=1 Tax=Bacillus cereus group sp. Bce002 TaxID=3445259 RepID=UPI003F1F56A3
MYLKTISIQNFRNYKGEHKFYLNSKINILYGNNGNGKSSFFDAIEWCLTGNIGRFIKRDKQAIANKHIELEEECSVKVYFSNYCIRRVFTKTTSGFSNDSFTLNEVDNNNNVINRIATGIENVGISLQQIFQEKGIIRRNSNNKFIDALKKAYILSQDQVVDFVIRDKGTERYNSLASIMGFEKIVDIRKNINSARNILDKNFKELELEMFSVSENIDRELSRKRKIDYKEYEKVKEQLGEDLSIEQIKAYDSRFRRELFNFEKRLEILQNIFDKGYKDVAGLEKDLDNKSQEVIHLEKLINDLQMQVKNEEELIYRHQSTIRDWNKNEKLRSNLQNHKDSIKKSQQKLSEMNINVDNLTIDALKEEIDYKQEKLMKLEFALRYKKEFDAANSCLSTYKDIFEKENKKLIEYNKRLKELMRQEAEIKDQLIDDNSSRLSKLIHNIEDILEFINNHNTKGICPVCTSDVGEHLQGKIESNMQRIMLSINDDKDNLKQLIKIRKEHNKEIELLNQRIKITTDTLEELERNRSMSIKNVEFIKNHKLFTDMFKYSYEWNEEKFDFSKKEIENLNLAIEHLREIEEKQAILKEYNVFTEGEIIPNSSIDPIHEALSLEIQKLEEIKEELTEQTGRLEENKKIKIDYEILLKNLQNIMEDIDIPLIEEVIIQYKGRIKAANYQISIMEKSREILEIQRFNQEINQEIDRLNNQKLIIDGKRAGIEQKVRVFSDLIGKLDKEFGEGTADFLNNNESSIQRYFRYLNPKPSEYSQLYFDITKNEYDHQELAIKILDENSNGYKVDANMALSSGQLNVLALSIFIATNEAQVNSYFDFIAIDDPIQNMDDLNRFSICDVLGGLDKQLIFSTHDQEFISLFLKKNEHQKDSVSVFLLSADEQKYEILEV